jgi:hypothetical protein
LYCLLFCSFSIGHCIVCYFVLFLLTIVLFVILFFFCWPLYFLLFCSFDFGRTRMAQWVRCHFQQYFSYIMATSFSGGRSRSTKREPPTMGKQLVKFITCGCLHYIYLMKLIRKSYYFNNSRLILPSKDENTIIQNTYFFLYAMIIIMKSFYTHAPLFLWQTLTLFLGPRWLYELGIWWQPVLVVEEAGVPRENHRPWASNW